jgi:hypothetical protein
MDDLPPRETPRAWIAAGIFLAAFTLAFVMLVFTHVRAHAQPCPPLEAMIEELGTKYGERIVWEGTAPTPQGPIEVMLFQSDKTWTIIQVKGISACIVAAGESGTPIETGRGV